MVDPSNYIPQAQQVIIPSFEFNVSGEISAFHLSGICGGAVGGVQPSPLEIVSCINILQVWRPLRQRRFSIAANVTATLRVPYATPVTTSVSVDKPIPFSSGDVLGFTPGPITGLFFQIATLSQQVASTRTAQSTHTYYTYDAFAMTLSANGTNRVSASPIISVEGTYVSAVHMHATTYAL